MTEHSGDPSSSVARIAYTREASATAGFWRRAAAFTVDALMSVMGAGLLGWFAACTAMVIAEAVGIAPPEVLLLFADSMFIVLGGSLLGYFVLPEASAWHATPGKVAFACAVQPATGTLSTSRVVLRRIAWILSPLTLGLGFVMMCWDPQRRTLHDRVSRTQVIVRPRSGWCTVADIALVSAVVVALAGINTYVQPFIHDLSVRLTQPGQIVSEVAPRLDDLQREISNLDAGTGRELDPKETGRVLASVSGARRAFEDVQTDDAAYRVALRAAVHATDQAELAVSSVNGEPGLASDSAEARQDALAAIAVAKMLLGEAVTETRYTPIVIDVLRDLIGLPKPETPAPDTNLAGGDASRTTSLAGAAAHLTRAS